MGFPGRLTRRPRYTRRARQRLFRARRLTRYDSGTLLATVNTHQASPNGVTDVTAEFGCATLIRSAGAAYARGMTSSNDSNGGPAIEVHDLRKSYGPTEAVRGVSFSVARGEVFCLLGPNGAGKTTIVEILEGYRSRSAGETRVLGFDPAETPRELRERVGIVLQQCGVQDD